MNELPLTHVERMDQLIFERESRERELKIQADRDIKVAKERRKEERSEMWLWLGVALIVGGIVFSLIYAWWILPDPPKTPEDYKSSEAGREEVCYQRGGGWVPKDLVYDGNGGSDHGLCVFPGKKAS